jgi:hypothetical protein
LRIASSLRSCVTPQPAHPRPLDSGTDRSYRHDLSFVGSPERPDRPRQVKGGHAGKGRRKGRAIAERISGGRHNVLKRGVELHPRVKGRCVADRETAGRERWVKRRAGRCSLRSHPRSDCEKVTPCAPRIRVGERLVVVVDRGRKDARSCPSVRCRRRTGVGRSEADRVRLDPAIEVAASHPVPAATSCTPPR